MKPLADKLRPQKIEEVFGQKHILGKDKVLSRLIEYGNIMNMIFYGPPGTGKTTVANIISKICNKKLYKLNATNASISDIKAIINDLNKLDAQNGVILYLDEIQNFNKKQQQSLLEFIENGKITLIASTTENPFFSIYNAILSRCNIFEFKPLSNEDIVLGLKRAIEVLRREYKDKAFIVEEKALYSIASLSGGDMRKSIGNLELIVNSNLYSDSIEIDDNIVKESITVKALSFNSTGDEHYHLLSAFQKSIRGSDPDAAVLYLAMLIKVGDIMSICRRLLVIASEDISLAYPQAIVIVKACTDSALQVGFPEARIPLSEATIFLATCPKSNSAYLAIDKALKDIESSEIGEIPLYLKDFNFQGTQGEEYKYPHNFENNYVPQNYMPKGLINRKYYDYGKNKLEYITKDYWSKIISKK